MLLENPPENPCFGCGPEHPRGLRMSFEREGDTIVSRVTPKADEIGWPGIMHTGLHFATLFEACYWAALELTGRVHVADGPVIYEHQRLPRVGATYTVRAQILSREPLRVAAQSATIEGKPLGRMECAWKLASRAGLERAGVELPRYLLDEMAP